MTCELCNGAEHIYSIAIHPYTKLEKLVSTPCVCYTSQVVSSEYKLLRHMGSNFMPPEKIPEIFRINLADPSKNANLIINGDRDSFLMMVKGLIMSHRFEYKKPRILFSRSIDIVHDFYVPREDGVSLHLSATSGNDLVILEFGTHEKNIAIAPCMSHIVQTRLDEEKPTWVYFPPTMPVLTTTCREFSSELMESLEKNFKSVEINTDLTMTRVVKSAARATAAQFGKEVESPEITPDIKQKRHAKRLASNFGK